MRPWTQGFHKCGSRTHTAPAGLQAELELCSLRGLCGSASELLAQVTGSGAALGARWGKRLGLAAWPSFPCWAGT